MKKLWFTMLLATSLSCLGLKAFGQSSETIDKMITEETANIQSKIALQRNGLGDPTLTAMAYSNRGKVLFFAQKHEEAERDFLQAIKLLESAPRPTDPDGKYFLEKTGSDAHVFLAQAQQAQGRPQEAFKTAAIAVRGYQKIASNGAEEVEPLVAYAVKTRIAALQEMKTVDKSERQEALQEADIALALLKKWSSKENGKFFADERELLVKAIEDVVQRAEQVSSQENQSPPEQVSLQTK